MDISLNSIKLKNKLANLLKIPKEFLTLYHLIFIKFYEEKMKGKNNYKNGQISIFLYEFIE